MDKTACSKYFLTKDEVLLSKDSDRKISARSLTLVFFAGVWAVCGRP